MINVPQPHLKIITVANNLASIGSTGGSTSEIIAAAFVLDCMEYLPPGYSVVEAWERLGDWQRIVVEIREQYSDLLVPW